LLASQSGARTDFSKGPNQKRIDFDKAGPKAHPAVGTEPVLSETKNSAAQVNDGDGKKTLIP